MTPKVITPRFLLGLLKNLVVVIVVVVVVVVVERRSNVRIFSEKNERKTEVSSEHGSHSTGTSFGTQQSNVWDPQHGIKGGKKDASEKDLQAIV